MRLCILSAALTLAVLLIGTGNARGQERLSVQDAIRQAITRNPDILAARGDLAAAEANKRGAKALVNPEILVSPSVVGSAGTDSAVLIAQPLEINGRRTVRGQIAAREADAASASTQAVARDIRRSVKQAYWEAVEAMAFVDLNRGNVELAQSHFDAAKRRRDVGTAPGSQVIKTEVELVRARQELAASGSELAKAKAVLNALLGRSPETDFLPTDGLEFTPLAQSPEQLRLAQLSRPEIAEAQALLEARRAEIRAAEILRRPDLAVEARQESFGGGGGIALAISLPFLDWGSVRGERDRAKAAANAQEQRVRATRNAVELDVRMALLDVQRLEERIRGYNEGLLSQSERLAELAQKGYKTGATGYLEALEAQRTLRSVKAEYYAALAGHAKALAQLEWAAGIEMPQAIATKGVK